MLTEQFLKNQREQLQEDLTCILDGSAEWVVDNACQVVVDHFAFLLANLDEVPQTRNAAKMWYETTVDQQLGKEKNMKDHNKIAKHLDNLLSRATPFHITDEAVVSGGVESTEHELYLRLKPILDAATPAVDEIEIAQAAEEKRPTNLNRPGLSPYWWHKEIPWAGTKALWIYCLPQLKEAIKAFNKERQEEYERYRQACLQGVAIAPEEGK